MESSITVILQEVSFSYPDGTKAVDNISFSVKEGEKLAIIGPNGAGKSTLLTLLNGVYEAKGEIRIFEFEVNRKNRRKIKSFIGLVFQNPDDQLFCPTIHEDVAFGPLNFGMDKEQIEHRVAAALKEVGLIGYGQRSSFHISYGERKLAGIATVLSYDPPLIALDEPTSNLDPVHRRKIINWIRNSERTFIVATHDLDMALETCERVIILNTGKIVADGPAGTILRNRKLLETNQLELPLMLQTP